MAKSDYKPKTQYIHIDEPEFYTFKEHAMIKIAIKVNKETGMGQAVSFGVDKAMGFINPKNIKAMRKFVEDHPDECKTISNTAHLTQESE